MSSRKLHFARKNLWDGTSLATVCQWRCVSQTSIRSWCKNLHLSGTRRASLTNSPTERKENHSGHSVSITLLSHRGQHQGRVGQGLPMFLKFYKTSNQIKTPEPSECTVWSLWVVLFHATSTLMITPLLHVISNVFL